MESDSLLSASLLLKVCGLSMQKEDHVWLHISILLTSRLILVSSFCAPELFAAFIYSFIESAAFAFALKSYFAALSTHLTGASSGLLN